MTADNQTSRLAGFYNLSLSERQKRLTSAGFVDDADLPVLNGERSLPTQVAENMIENVVGRYSLPLGIATNFIINDREVLVPMVVEEPSVVAGASYMAKLVRQGGGFAAAADPPVMIGQIQLLEVPDLAQAHRQILDQQAQLLEKIKHVDPVLTRLGGGPRGLEVRVFDQAEPPFLVVHLLFDVRDAMGANAVNTACESLAPHLEEVTGGRAGLRILSNLADRRLARAECSIPPSALAFEEYSGEFVRDRVVEAWAFADADPYRAATHNKGIMNGIDAVVMATANDWRAVEAGAHAYASRQGRYRSLSTWKVDQRGHLRGTLELPLAIGTVGGATRVHPGARLCLKIMEVETSRELAEILVSVGLAQNLAALRALATEGIQRGHMTLHARQVAIAAGAEGPEIQRTAEQMAAEDNISLERAREILAAGGAVQ